MANSRIYLGIVCVTCFTLGVVVGYLPHYYAAPHQGNGVTQVSTIDAILNGLYDGVITYGDLKEYGDFGIGTFEG